MPFVAVSATSPVQNVSYGHRFIPREKDPAPTPYVDSLSFRSLEFSNGIQRLYKPKNRLKQHFLLH